MSTTPSQNGGDLFIVDNSDTDWKVRQYLYEWADIARAFDIATGYFEIGALLALDGKWQQLEKLRILMGDEVSKRTKAALVEGVQRAAHALDQSIDREKETNDFLEGVPAIVDALRTGKVECRVYDKAKFHAKAYITHAKSRVLGPSALVGSSNFTVPGLTDNIELNIQIRREVDLLQEWYEQHWDKAEDITPEILRVIERHTREYSPFEVYAKALDQLFRGRALTPDEWDLTESRMYPVLDQYQVEGYRNLLDIAARHNGAFLCDGVGLGKTFIGLMLIERLVMKEGKNVLLLVPKAARQPVWEASIRRYLPHLASSDFNHLAIYNHTDLSRGGDFVRRMDDLQRNADVIIIDEAHHFRNTGIRGRSEDQYALASRYWRLYDLIGDKTTFFLTATPINNGLLDLLHLIELFSREDNPGYFKAAPLAIPTLRGHFRTMQMNLDALLARQNQGTADVDTNEVEAQQVLMDDRLFQALVVQRSRAYVQESQSQNGRTAPLFPVREDPKVQPYSVKKTYGRLLEMFEKAFQRDKPLFSLAIYNPDDYRLDRAQVDSWIEGRQRQVVGLIRINFLKRFESSAYAFKMSCETLLIKLLAWVEKHSESQIEKRRLEKWMLLNAGAIGYVKADQQELFPSAENDESEDIITDDMLESVEALPRDIYDVDAILDETYDDLNQLVRFMEELQKFEPKHDDKLKALVSLLKTDPVLKKHKVLIFSEFSATARYLRDQLKAAGITGVDQVDSGDPRDRGQVIRQFSPYYNGTSSAELEAEKLTETRVLISTDVLSEGLNLQDATRLINYDLHWNPVRLMQRIGRVDRRMNPAIETCLVVDHPEVKKIRGTAAYWNFLPPGELDDLLKLYSKVARKTLTISKTFGIEGKKLLKPEDDYEALREFNEAYLGKKTPMEELRVELRRLFDEDASLEDRLAALPSKVFSGKRRVDANASAVFFCFALPGPEYADGETKGDAVWTEAAGRTAWYLYDMEQGKVVSEDPTGIAEIIRCAPDTPRETHLPKPTLSEVRKAVEKHIKNTYLRAANAPQGVKPALKAWMEVC